MVKVKLVKLLPYDSNSIVDLELDSVNEFEEVLEYLDTLAVGSSQIKYRVADSLDTQAKFTTQLSFQCKGVPVDVSVEIVGLDAFRQFMNSVGDGLEFRAKKVNDSSTQPSATRPVITDVPTCPTHGVPMKPFKKKDGFFCSKKVDAVNFCTYVFRNGEMKQG